MANEFWIATDFGGALGLPTEGNGPGPVSKTLAFRPLSALGLAIVATVTGYSVRPDGWAWTGVKSAASALLQRQRIRHEWSQLVSIGGRLDAGGDSVVVVEFADYQCPFCRQEHVRMTAFERMFPRAGVVYRHFPLAKHPFAEGAARAAICGEAFGIFPALHAYLMETDQWMADTDWVGHAKRNGLRDTNGFRMCLTSAATTKRLQADVQLGRALGIAGTPTIVFWSTARVGIVAPETMDSIVHNR